MLAFNHRRRAASRRHQTFHQSAGLNCRKNRSGLTLIELLVVMGIVSLLVAISMPAVLSARQSAREMTDANRVRQLCLTAQDHADTHDHLPGPYTGFVGIDAGWSCAALAGSGERAIVNSFSQSQPLDYAGNLKVAEHARPDIFKAECTDDMPFRVSATDDPNVVLNIPSTSLAFNGFLLNKRIEQIPSKTQTAMFARLGPCGLWIRSPEFHSIEPPARGESVLIGFVDGSVRRCTLLTDVIFDPSN